MYQVEWVFRKQDTYTVGRWRRRGVEWSGGKGRRMERWKYGKRGMKCSGKAGARKARVGERGGEEWVVKGRCRDGWSSERKGGMSDGEARLGTVRARARAKEIRNSLQSAPILRMAETDKAGSHLAILPILAWFGIV